MDADAAGAEALERARVRARFSAASASYDAAARLQRIVRAELLERVGGLGITPRVVLDLGAGTGHATRALKQRFPASLVVAADLAPGMLQQAGRLLGWRERLLGGRFGLPFERVAADAQRLPFASRSVDLVFSNLMLQWCPDLSLPCGEIARVLAAGGAFAFSTFGPGTLQELRAAWAEVDAGPHVHRFLDMHDVGAALMQAGLQQPVLDVDTHELAYDQVLDLMRDLQRIGAGNAAATRARGLTGRAALARMTAAYERLRQSGSLPSTWEVIYGLAWAADAGRRDTRGTGEAAEVRVPLERIGRRMREGTR